MIDKGAQRLSDNLVHALHAILTDGRPDDPVRALYAALRGGRRVVTVLSAGAPTLELSIRLRNRKAVRRRLEKTAPRICPHCGRTIRPKLTGRPPTYCRDACRQAAARRRRNVSPL